MEDPMTLEAGEVGKHTVPQQQRRGVRGAVAWWSKWHALDYALVVVLFVVWVGLAVGVDPYRNQLPLNATNPTVAFSLRPDSVPSWSAGVIAFIAPSVGFAAAQFPAAVSAHRSGKEIASAAVMGPIFHDLHHSVLGLLQAVAIEGATVEATKLFAGRYRPNYLALAALNDPKLEREGRKSFPSGHAATAFVGMTYLALWIAGKLRAFRSPGAGSTWRLVATVAPMWVAMLVAVSRTRDNWHNFSDILAGAVVGAFCAVASYFSLYPSLLSASCGLPYSKSIAAGIPAEGEPFLGRQSSF